MQRRWKLLLVCSGVFTVAVFGCALYAYTALSRRVDARLAAGPFVHTISFYSAPATFSAGDTVRPEDAITILKRCGYRESATPDAHTYSIADNSVTLYPGNPAAPPSITLRFAKGQIASITDESGPVKLSEFTTDPAVITNISEAGRERRTIIHFPDLPTVLVQAVVSAEDKRFFEHRGLDPLRIVKAAYVDTKDRHKEQGASTITMQLARNLWLDHDKNWKRKITEALITLHLEQKLSKEQIFEDYANEVYLGERGSFGIDGFGEAAKAYFNKDVRKLNLPESALIAGLVQRPSYFNPFRYPDRAMERRNVVLRLMRQNRYITDAQFEQAVNAPLGLVSRAEDASETQYFLDVASDHLQRTVNTSDLNGLVKVYTTLDPRLQIAAEKAISSEMANIDRLIRNRKDKRGRPEIPQVALIALDPHTGEVKALCGGRDYTSTQLNRVLSKRPPGSVFKPFVYAAALSTALSGSGAEVLTPESTVDDSPTTFLYANRPYSPDNFEHKFHGTVTLRRALAQSMNVAAVKVGEMAGFNSVVALAKHAGMNADIQPTPAVALGAYDVTPLEIATAYTIFVNQGNRVNPAFISSVSSSDGTELYRHEAHAVPVLDPRITFLMDDMLQEVLRSGTAAGVRARGFKLIAAGKTGTSHDGWFAGFTSQLLCIVWVGFDDYSELNLEGAKSALPIWTDFMQQAAQYRQYRQVKQFDMPSGIVKAAVDPDSGQLAVTNCPTKITDYFVDGTEPTVSCALHSVQTGSDSTVASAGQLSNDGLITVISNSDRSVRY